MTTGKRETGLRLISGHWQDNVVRREQFESRHPDIAIRCDKRGFNWYAARDGVDIAHELGLGRLLNRLEVLTGERN